MSEFRDWGNPGLLLEEPPISVLILGGEEKSYLGIYCLFATETFDETFNRESQPKS